MTSESPQNAANAVFLFKFSSTNEYPYGPEFRARECLRPESAGMQAR
jgi:hypothetical protein